MPNSAGGTTQHTQWCRAPATVKVRSAHARIRTIRCKLWARQAAEAAPALVAGVYFEANARYSRPRIALQEHITQVVVGRVRVFTFTKEFADCFGWDLSFAAAAIGL